jgi:hypothetical protein
LRGVVEVKEMETAYTGRIELRELLRGGGDHFAEVTVRAHSCVGPSEVIVSSAVLDYLREVFGSDFEHHRHCVWAAVAAQIATANVAGEMPHVGVTSFHAEVIEVEVSGNAGREVSGALLTSAGMRAIGRFLVDWERSQSGSDGLDESGH